VNLEVSEAQEAERPLVDGLLQYYAYDFSEFIDSDVAADGRFHSVSLGDWPSESRRVFLFRIDGKPAGFAAVDAGSQAGGGPDVTDMGEFFVMRKYRSRGAGARAAHILFDRFPGPWEVRELSTNLPAQAFWRSVIAQYTDGQFDERTLDDERWRGPVQSFIAKARAPAS